MNKKNLNLIFLIIISAGLFSAKNALAICPLCTIAVGAGIGFSRWLGVDDAISGLWIGGLSVSLISWTLNWLRGKKINFKGLALLTSFFYYLLIITPLYYLDIIGNPLNTLCGCPFLDKLLIGIIVGSFGFWFAVNWHYFLKKKNNGQVFFPFQKVLMPLSLLFALSILFYFLTI